MRQGMKVTAAVLVASSALMVLAGGSAAIAQSSTRPAFGCFTANADLNIRDTAFATGAVIATAQAGDILVKRKRFCTLRGFWCAVSYEGIDGWADKSFMTVTPCPANLSKPVN